MTAAKRLAVLTGAAALATVLVLVAAAAPGASRDEAATSGVQVPGAPVNAVIESLPQPVESATPEPAPLPVTAEPAAHQSRWSIDIDVTGYQPELDACLWVRMDLGAAAPIVGAHNHCGGGVILEMAVGDTVTLHGTSLDGEYLVDSARDAWAGDDAAEATAGMTATVILQTCYWQNSGRELLLGLVRSS